MSRRVVAVHALPDPDRVAGAWPASDRQWVGVAVDVLRATSTLTAARRAGAARIVPCVTVDEALDLRRQSSRVLACGERGGRIVPGFDLGNSPFEYTPERVGLRTLAFASTNGSRALRALAMHREVWLGAFVSGSALARALDETRPVRIVCAGDRGGLAPEDLAFAGWLVARLVERGWTAEGETALQLLASAPVGENGVRAAVTGAPHAATLSALGEDYVRDVTWCATLDALPRAERLGEIRSESS